MKRIISIALALVMLLSVAVVAVSAAEVNDSNVGADSGNSAGADSSSSSSGSGSTIYFDASGWKNVTQVYCHIWKRGGDSFFNWMTKKEKCTKEGDLWAYDCSKVSLKSNEDYCLCFAADPSKIQTYDTTFSEKCFGDTVKLTGNKIENPVDSEKKADEAVWTKNSGSYGPHLAFTSIGNIVGSKLCPNEKGTEVIGDWVPTYYKSTYIKDKVATLAKAYPRFGIKDANDITTIYAYILQKKTGEDEAAMKKLLEDAFAKAYPSKKGVKIDTKKAKSQAESIKKSGGHVTSSGSTGSSSAGASGSSSGSSYSGGSSNSSGSGSDGEEDTIFFVLFGIMAAAAGVMYVTRRKRTE